MTRDPETTSYVYAVTLTATIYTARPLTDYSHEEAQGIVVEHLQELPLADALAAAVSYECVDIVDDEQGTVQTEARELAALSRIPDEARRYRATLDAIAPSPDEARR